MGLEHIPLGILAQPGKVETCQALGASTSEVAKAIHEYAAKGPIRADDSRGKAVIMHAIELSRERWHESIGTDHLLLAVLKVASRELIDAFESTGLRCNELADELARRNPPGKSPPPGPLEMLVKEYEKHPEFQALHQRIESLQQQQEDAVMRHDFIVAARLRDERLEVRRALTALIMSLRPPSRPETGSS